MNLTACAEAYRTALESGATDSAILDAARALKDATPDQYLPALTKFLSEGYWLSVPTESVPKPIYKVKEYSLG